MNRHTPFKLELAKITITQEEILADLLYPARKARPLKTRPRSRRR